MVKGGSLAHKTPVLVIRQKLKEDGKGGYTGWLQIVRLDTREICYIKASCFATLPYWQLPIAEILTVQGIVFTGNESGSAAPEILYFRETDLTVLY